MAKIYGLIGGVLLFGLLLLLPSPSGLSEDGWHVFAVIVLMSVWWSTEALPIAVTAALPFLLFPPLGIMKPADIAESYMAPPMFLVLGSTMLSLAIARWGLHLRMARAILSRSGGGPRALLFGLMLTTAIVAAIVHNTAAMLIMLPIALAIVAIMGDAAPDAARDVRAFGAATILATLYGAMIGGFATLIGSPTNPLLAGMIEKQYGIHIGFVQWAAFGIPFAAVCLPVAWLIVARLAFRFAGLPSLSSERMAGVLGQAAPWTTGERRTMLVALATAAAWILLPFVGGKTPLLSDAGIAIVAMIALCAIPAGTAIDGEARPKLLDIAQVRAAPWHILFLFGGGVALAAGVGATDLGQWPAGRLEWLTGLPPLAMLALFALILIAITEWASNFAMYAAFMPLTVVLAGGDPRFGLALGMVVALAANWSFMMPVATLPNALAISTGHVSVPQMMRSGLYLDILGGLVIAGICGAIAAILPLA